jgi:lysophospholipase L1-like esterase
MLDRSVMPDGSDGGETGRGGERMLTAIAEPGARSNAVKKRHSSAGERRMSFGRYAALGDSFTARRSSNGLSWPDELVMRLADRAPGLTHHNFAQPGATSRDLLERQLPPAVEFAPDLVTVICGVNDVLLPGQPDLVAYADRFARMVDTFRAVQPDVIIVTATCPNKTCCLPLTGRARRQLINGIELLNEVTRRVCARLAVACVEPGAWLASPRSVRDHQAGVTDDAASAGRDTTARFADAIHAAVEAADTLGLLRRASLIES